MCVCVCVCVWRSSPYLTSPQVAASLAYGGAAAAAVVAVGAAVGGSQALLGVSEPVWLTSLEALLGLPSAGVGLVLALLACLDMRRVG